VAVVMEMVVGKMDMQLGLGGGSGRGLGLWVAMVMVMVVGEDGSTTRVGRWLCWRLGLWVAVVMVMVIGEDGPAIFHLSVAAVGWSWVLSLLFVFAAVLVQSLINPR
jgi:hypothetical protein